MRTLAHDLAGEIQRNNNYPIMKTLTDSSGLKTQQMIALNELLQCQDLKGLYQTVTDKLNNNPGITGGLLDTRFKNIMDKITSEGGKRYRDDVTHTM